MNDYVDRVSKHIPTSDSLAASAKRFAASAIEAYGSTEAGRVALDAGIALEHLAKACLARRSPVLLTELKPGNWHSMLMLMSIPEAKPKHLRTIGAREAIDRVRVFVSSTADMEAVARLVDLRDGLAHVGDEMEPDEEILLAFIQQSNSYIEDLGVDRNDYWGPNLSVVEELASAAGTKIDQRVRARVAASKARFLKVFAEMTPEMLTVMRSLAPVFDPAECAAQTCPACGSLGVACGDFEVDWVPEYDKHGDIEYMAADITFHAASFECARCQLHLDNATEIAASGMAAAWELPDADPHLYEFDHWDQDLTYEAWRESH